MTFVLWMTGRPCSGKTTISKKLEKIIPNLATLDGDSLYEWLGTYDFSRESQKYPRNSNALGIGSGPIFTPNDWKCLACKRINFASNNSCKFCGNMKILVPFIVQAEASSVCSYGRVRTVMCRDHKQSRLLNSSYFECLP